jgi:predicted RNA polymerase sigma factor
VIGALTRRHGDFAICEDAVQDALVDAVRTWPRRGWPDNPAAWLTTAASRRLGDRLRSEAARRRWEAVDAGPLDVEANPSGCAVPPGARSEGPGSEDRPDGDVLALLVLCCHPSHTSASQVALTLRAVGGLTSAQIARAFLGPEATMGQRISRAKQRIRAAGARFEPFDSAASDDRLTTVTAVLYLLFNEGYATTGGDDLLQVDLTSEAIRLARQVHRLRPDDGEAAGLLALMLLHDARREARTGPAGALVPLDEQDRSRWDRSRIEEGVELITRALSTAPLGPYQLQAAIAAVHDEAATADDTDWPQIAALYDLLQGIAPGPVVSLNRIVALANVQGPHAGLDLLAGLEPADQAALAHRLDVVRGHLLERTGHLDRAATALTQAARRTTSLPERRYLAHRARTLRTRP